MIDPFEITCLDKHFLLNNFKQNQIPLYLKKHVRECSVCLNNLYSSKITEKEDMLKAYGIEKLKSKLNSDKKESDNYIAYNNKILKYFQSFIDKNSKLILILSYLSVAFSLIGGFILILF